MTPSAEFLCCRSYAKINLYLDVLDRRADGFNNIETIFQTVGLYDELHLERTESELSLTCSNPGLPTGDGNLVIRAARALLEHTGAQRGARMHLVKHIPVAAGLAGGSGNAAAALRGLNTIWELGLRDAALAALALRLGSDVPYCLHGGTMAATGRGEILVPLAPIPETPVVLVNPGIAISAGAVYKHPRLERSEETPFNGMTPTFLAISTALASCGPAPLLFNRMEAPVFEDHPEVARIKEVLCDHGCQAALMSGSGSTVFGVSDTPMDAAALQAAFPDYFVACTTTVDHGVTMLDRIAPAT